MITISKTFEFAACHRLYRPEWDDEKNRAVFGKCSNPGGHGHNYQLEVSVAGPVDAETGMVLDASILDKLVHESIFEDLDHKNLNEDVSWLEGKVTTVEVIADAIWKRLAPKITDYNSSARLRQVKLWETGRIFAMKEADE